MVFEVLGSLKSTKKLSKRQQKRLGGLFLRLGGLLLSMLEAKASLGRACWRLKGCSEGAKWCPPRPGPARVEQSRLVSAIQL